MYRRNRAHLDISKVSAYTETAKLNRKPSGSQTKDFIPPQTLSTEVIPPIQEKKCYLLPKFSEEGNIPDIPVNDTYVYKYNEEKSNQASNYGL